MFCSGTRPLDSEEQSRSVADIQEILRLGAENRELLRAFKSETQKHLESLHKEVQGIDRRITASMETTATRPQRPDGPPLQLPCSLLRVVHDCDAEEPGCYAASGIAATLDHEFLAETGTGDAKPASASEPPPAGNGVGNGTGSESWDMWDTKDTYRSSASQDNADERGSDLASDDPVNINDEEKDFLHGVGGIDRPAHDIKVNFFGLSFQLIAFVEWASLTVVCLNTVFTILQADSDLEYAVKGTAKPAWIDVVDCIFTIVFTTDFVARWWLWGRVFLQGADRVWNVIDLVCVASSVLDLVVSFVDMSFVRVARILRVVRIFRALRGMRSIRDLRMMIGSIMATLASLVWGFCLLAFVILLSSIGLIQSLVIAESFGAALSSSVYDNYGTVMKSSFTLFQAITGGQDWDDLLEPLRQVSHGYTVFFLLYVFIMMFGVTNVLTAAFVEKANEIVQVDPQLVIEDEMNRMKDIGQQLQTFFRFSDEDHDGMMNVQELERFLRPPERQAMLHILNVDVAEARALFELMDADKSGVVNLHSFIEAITRLKGTSKGCDTALVLYETRRMMLRLSRFMSYTADNFKTLFKEMECGHKQVMMEDYIGSVALRKREADTRVQLQRQLCSHLGANAKPAPQVPHDSTPGSRRKAANDVLHNVPAPSNAGTELSPHDGAHLGDESAMNEELKPAL